MRIQRSDTAPPPARRGVCDLVIFALACCYLTSLICVCAVLGGHKYLKEGPHFSKQNSDWPDAFANWDGKWYRQIAESGYAYDPKTISNVAFFPAFPLLGRSLADATGLGANEALFIVANLCLAGAFVFMAKYLRQRLGHEAGRVGPYVLLALGLLPTTFFLRMAYSESLFLLTALAAMYGMERRWPVVIVALIVGLATATRPVGVALLAPLLLHVWAGPGTFPGRLLKLAVVVPIACWGILSYMLFQWLTFDDPLAFARTQGHWRIRPAVSLGEQALCLMTLEPIRSVYDPSSPCYWGLHDANVEALFSIQFANPLYFLAAWALIVVGWWKGWLNRGELALAAGLLLIPYVTRSHEMCMGSMGRFAAVVFPMYLVLGQLLSRMPAAVAALVLALSGFWMGVNAALFAAWYRVF